MNRVLPFCSLLLLLIFCSSICASPNERVVIKFNEGVMIYEFSHFSEQDCSEELRDKLLKCSDCPGIDGFLPDRTTTSIKLRLGGSTYRIPSNLAEDLYNPHIGKEFLDNPCIAIESNFILIDMGGGDGSAAYRARFVINLENLVARRELYQFPSIEKAQISEGKMDREIGDER